jgi:hypothetical protein
MPKKTAQKTAKAAPPSVPAKRPGIRTLQNLEDLRRLQAKLLKQFLSGELSRDDYKASVYGCGSLAQTMKFLEPEPKPAGWVSELVLVRSEFDDEDERVIAQMNSTILPAPDDNGVTN